MTTKPVPELTWTKGAPDPSRPGYEWWFAEVRWDILDEKARVVGTVARVAKYESAPGDFYVSTRATRGGKGFGSAFPRATMVGSLEAAKALAARKVEAARRRAHKAFGSVGEERLAEALAKQ